MSREPSRLKKGKQFHDKVKKDWKANAEGNVELEKGVTKQNKKRGRIDVIVDSHEDVVAVVELKCSNWDAMTEKNVRRNVRRQIRQIWSYVEPILATGRTVCPGIVFPLRPETPGRLEMIEEWFIEEGIPVVWEDESKSEQKTRKDVKRKRIDRA